ncbi:MAG: alkaline phosphatase family protein [Saprospiraceae bacterium]|nr:alkaline phosphatase family protein [Saprospiraceae bacterium]
MTKHNFIYLLLSFIVLLSVQSCKTRNLTVDTQTINSKESLQKPYVVLISLDGFRWDYVEKYQPPHLTNFIKNGVQAESLIPSFPSKTFPNHYSIATGLYPENHRIIGNAFYSYDKKVIYKIGNRVMVEDGSFYSGTPLWVLADNNKMVSASYFFVGSEANIQGKRPTYYKKYDGSVKNEIRVAQSLEWFTLPPKERPHMITMYFSDMDDIGHKFGPDNEAEIKKALFALDQNLGDFFKGVAATGLPIDIIIVSDHGMATVKTEHLIPIDPIENDSYYTAIDNGSMVNIHIKNDSEMDSILQLLASKQNHFKVYKTANTPGFEYKPKNKDWGDIQIIPDFGYYFSKQSSIDSRIKNSISEGGVHGYDPNFKEMHGIFYANGPSFKKGLVVPSIKNIHVYPLICKILDLDIPKDIDGKLDILEGVLK